MKPTLCVHSAPFRAYIESIGLSFRELGRRYADRFDVDEGSGCRKVSSMLNEDLITLDAADRLAVLVDRWPGMIWGPEYMEPIEVASIVAHNKREKVPA